jgi:hypothetical protein
MVGSGLYAPVFSNRAWVTLATCGVVSATLDDALAVEERPNMPAMVVVSDT